MAERKKTITTASDKTVSEIKKAQPVGNASGLRTGAIILWILAFAFEVLAVLVFFGKINITFMSTLTCAIIFIVLDLACVIIGAQLWKKANHIAPASKANPTKFWLWNNMGVIVACFAFIPLIILLFTNKNIDKKTKTVGIIVAIIALLIGGVASYDFNPISAEEKNAAMAAITDGVYYTPYGKVYHTHVIDDGTATGHVHMPDDEKDCPYLNRSDSLTYGTVEEAIAAGKTRLCSYCARHDGINTEGILTDGE